VDGATILDSHGHILGFGAKIRLPSTLPDMPPPIQNTLWGDLADVPGQEVDWAGLGGTRHLSAALFAAHNHRAMVAVCSADGPMKIMSWSKESIPPRVLVLTDVELMLIPEIRLS
jgi:hypothetical protein